MQLVESAGVRGGETVQLRCRELEQRSVSGASIR